MRSRPNIQLNVFLEPIPNRNLCNWALHFPASYGPSLAMVGWRINSVCFYAVNSNNTGPKTKNWINWLDGKELLAPSVTLQCQLTTIFPLVRTNAICVGQRRARTTSAQPQGLLYIPILALALAFGLAWPDIWMVAALPHRRTSPMRAGVCK